MEKDLPVWRGAVMMCDQMGRGMVVVLQAYSLLGTPGLYFFL